MTAPDLQSLAQLFTERMLNTAAEGVVLSLLVWVLLRLIGRQDSGARFAIWFMALLGLVALPFVAGSGLDAAHSAMIAAAKLRGEIILSGSWAMYLFAAWAVGASVLLLRLGVGLWQVRRLRSDCREVDLGSLEPAAAAILQDFMSCRRVKVCTSSDVSAPAVLGLFRPAIVFPERLLPQLSPGEIEVILLHENAHLCRWDQWTNLTQKLVKAVFFFHPAVWWIENRLTLEREMACDDMVLAHSTSPRAYASFLISFAEKMQNARGLALAQALLSRARQMSLRVAQILDAKRPPRTSLWAPLLGVGPGLLAVVFGAAPYLPKLVVFQAQPRAIQSRQMQATRENVGPAAIDATSDLSRTAAHPVSQAFHSAPRARAIPAAYHPRTAVVPMHWKATSPRNPMMVRTKVGQADVPGQETFVVVQSTEYDSSGSGVWTLCIWRIKGGKLAEKQLESAIAQII